MASPSADSSHLLGNEEGGGGGNLELLESYTAFNLGTGEKQTAP